MDTEKNKTNEPHKFILDLLQRSELTSLNKHVALKNLSVYNT